MFTTISSFTVFFLIGILATVLCLIFEDKLISFEQKVIRRFFPQKQEVRPLEKVVKKEEAVYDFYYNEFIA